jgi:Mo-dependent nitrogenase C-terminus
MSTSHHNTEKLAIVSWGWIQPAEVSVNLGKPSATALQPSVPAVDVFLPIRRWLDNLQVQSPELAHRICRLIPAQCPFERTVKLFGYKVLHIPPLCKLNPVYDQVVALRFRALCYLADVCGEDISPYC